MPEVWWAPIVAVLLLAMIGYLWRPRRRAARTARLAQAKRRFHAQRERLEAKFVQLAAARAPRWADCAFDDDVAYVRNRATGELSAFVAVTLAAEDCRGSHGRGDAVGNLQAGTAVFRFDRDHWETDGRAILNLSPSEAVQHYRENLEIVGEEFAHHQ